MSLLGIHVDYEKPVIMVKEGDYGYTLTFSIKEADGTAKNLTDYDVVFKVWRADGSMVVIKTCTVENPTEGIVSFIVAEGDWVAGVYNFEFECTKTGIKESTVTGILIVERSK